MQNGGPRLRILHVSDFFYPNVGGVETHIYTLCQCLIARGHKVVVLTHAYGERTGVRWMANGLKVYYIARRPIYQQVTMPTIFGGFALFRAILIRERIQIVHCHQAFSTMAHEATLHARTMGYKTVFTDHSLFGFADVASILMNKCLKFTLADVHQVICVSHTSRENTVLRACLPPHRVSVIPNAVDAAGFTPDLAARDPGGITIVALSRMVYRKGVDLLALVIPELCRRHPSLHFLVGGDGPKAALLRQMVEREGLGERVELLGAVAQKDVRAVLTRGHIFINASLTEAFCMAIVEAAAAGLLVVSTRVGGVPEVLPGEMLLLAEPQPRALLEAVEKAILHVPLIDPLAQHEKVSSMYSWPRIAARTEVVYYAAIASKRDDSLAARFARYAKCGIIFGKLCCCVAAADYLLWKLVEWWFPEGDIDIAPDFQSCQQPADAIVDDSRNDFQVS